MSDESLARRYSTAAPFFCPETVALSGRYGRSGILKDRDVRCLRIVNDDNGTKPIEQRRAEPVLSCLLEVAFDVGLSPFHFDDEEIVRVRLSSMNDDVRPHIAEACFDDVSIALEVREFLPQFVREMTSDIPFRLVGGLGEREQVRLRGKQMVRGARQHVLHVFSCQVFAPSQSVPTWPEGRYDVVIKS